LGVNAVPKDETVIKGPQRMKKIFFTGVFPLEREGGGRKFNATRHVPLFGIWSARNKRQGQEDRCFLRESKKPLEHESAFTAPCCHY